MTIFESEFINLRLDVSPGNALIFFEAFIIDLVIEMADISNNSIIFHFRHMLSHNDVFVSCGCDEYINFVNKVLHCDNFITLHACLKSTDGINF